ncbi:glycosyltransferase family 2 protein [Rubellimicrobium mesophilum]|uniref:glycosyltransferase family 2 protein n=1 Tax=Rubellimicrobium mesophilum TaxID=1123067 RepID=UPI00147045C5|nr:glycosyltransferase [Rubellimicrobium mesophilum]
MTPKTSVVVVTYNHAAFIDQALESVLGQRTDHDFEVIISEDASTDGTHEIVKRWQERFPSVVRLLLSEKNLRSNETVRRGFHAARGKYVSLLDGDDCWSSPDKLARQAAVLDADPSLSLCFHNAVVSTGTTRFGGLWTDPSLKARLGLADLWEGNPFATCGSMFRRACVPRIPDWYCQVGGMITDWPLYVLFAEKGDIAFLPEAMGVYRLHPGGAFSPKSDLTKLETMEMLYRIVNEGTEFRHDKDLRAGHGRYFLDMARTYLDQGRTDLARRCLREARSYRPRGQFRGLAEAFSLEVRSWLRRRASL